ncbi:unnamed protein product [Didymodactylos carnosus]|uniref:F-box domain-containing protein n=1 Tax=Didymodactylos carnosus TaxID=1234261 RepID=A0A813YWI6_9BILA|nr:unnamed protein product [Didymodactylos carnosus]CAF3674522.1 unnamed protein product [Didymodactylos carnosus]
MVSKFDDLSNEVILCIFEYLSPAEKFCTFFNCNDRLHQLMKKWTNYSRKSLKADVDRYSTLHSWYKHLTFDEFGTLCYILPRKGEQPRYSFDPRIRDSNGIHWHFLGSISHLTDKPIQKIVQRFPFRLNPLFYNSGNNTSSYLMVVRKNYKEYFETTYPVEYKQCLTNNGLFDYKNDIISKLLRQDYERQYKDIQQAADCVWNGLKELNDLNILNIN